MKQKTTIAYKYKKKVYIGKPKVTMIATLAPGEEKAIYPYFRIRANSDNKGTLCIGKEEEELSILSDHDGDGLQYELK